MKEFSCQWLSMPWNAKTLSSLSKKTRGNAMGTVKKKKTSPSVERIYPFEGDNMRYLTQREAEVLEYICLGHTQATTAAKLELSPRTVEFYIKNVRARWQVRTQRELCQLILQMKQQLVG